VPEIEIKNQKSKIKNQKHLLLIIPFIFSSEGEEIDWLPLPPLRERAFHLCPLPLRERVG